MAITLSTIRRSLHIPLPSLKRRGQLDSARSPSDSRSVKTVNEIKKLATQWADSTRSPKVRRRDSARLDAIYSESRSPGRSSQCPATGAMEDSIARPPSPPAIEHSPEDLVASLNSHGSTGSDWGNPAAVTFPSTPAHASALSEGSTTSSGRCHDAGNRCRPPIASSPSESEASFRSLDHPAQVPGGFRDRQRDKVRKTAGPSPRGVGSITPVGPHDSAMDHEPGGGTQIRRKKKACDLRSAHRRMAPRAAASTHTTTTPYAFPALALLADDPQSYREWIAKSPADHAPARRNKRGREGRGKADARTPSFLPSAS